MDLRHLRAFVAVVDSGGFSRAAGRLHISQSALSRQIHALETTLDVRLFDRIGRRVQLTAEGDDLLRRARRLLADVESLGDRARVLKRGETGVLRMGSTPQAIETLLAGFLPGYRRRHPGVEVRLVEDGGERMRVRLERGDVHLSFLSSGDARFHWRPVMPLYVLAVVPASHRFARRATVPIEDLADAPLMLLRREFASRGWFDAAVEVAHIQPRVLLESGAPSALMALVRAGYGIAIVPSMVRVPAAGLRGIPLVQRGTPLGRWLGIAWDPRRVLPPYAEQFVEELVRYCRGAPVNRFLRRAPRLPRSGAATQPD